MNAHYIKILIRSLLKNRLIALIKISGLAIGLAGTILIFLYIKNEYYYDRFTHHADKIFRVAANWTDKDGSQSGFAKIPFPVGPAMLNDFPEVVNMTRFMAIRANDGSGVSVKYQDKKFAEEGFYVADSGFLSMFHIEFVKGDPETAFQHPNSVIITEATAFKYFGKNDPLGEVWKVENYYDMTVTGVIKSINHQSHLEFDILAPFSFLQDIRWGGWDGFENDWFSFFTYTYIQLLEPELNRSLENKLAGFIETHNPRPEERSFSAFDLFLQPLTSIHLTSELRREIKPNNSIPSLISLAAIAVFILILACINFMNLATARFSQRSKEIGLRKVLGASRNRLISQFLGESLIITIISTILALIISFLLIPYFNQTMDAYLDYKEMITPDSLIFMATTILITGFIAGSYPAIMLSGFKITRVLKGGVEPVSRSFSLRKALVIFQFVLTGVFLIVIIVIGDQLQYILNKNLGLNPDQVISIKRPPQSIQNDVIMETFLNIQGVKKVGIAAGSLPGRNYAMWSFHPEGFPRERRAFYTLWTYHGIEKVLDLELIAGAYFSPEMAADTNTLVLLNQAAIKDLGWSAEDAVGKYFGEFDWQKDDITPGKVVGVIKDFNFQSLHMQIKPMAMVFTANDFGDVLVKIDPEYVSKTLVLLETTWNELLPDLPFSFAFLEQDIDKMYQKEVSLSRATNGFTLLAIFIASMGLLGLAIFTTERKTKEIGIRKVLGASIRKIMILLNKEFAKLIMLALLISMPVGYLIVYKWLSNFAYRIDIGMKPFLAAFLTVIIVTFLTVSLQSLKASMANPVDSLRDE